MAAKTDNKKARERRRKGRRKQDLELEQVLLDQRAILDNMVVGLAHLRDGRFIWVNGRTEEILGYDGDGLTGLDASVAFASADELAKITQAMRSTSADNARFAVDCRMRRRHGSSLWARVSGHIDAACESGQGTIWAIEDISERREAEERINHQVNYDALTDLPNRRLFQDRLHLELDRATRAGRQLAVLYVDLDNFKVVNDSLGHAVGDKLLVRMAERMKSCLREVDILSRVGGDIFVGAAADRGDLRHVDMDALCGAIGLDLSRDALSQAALPRLTGSENVAVVTRGQTVEQLDVGLATNIGIMRSKSAALLPKTAHDMIS